MVGFLKKLLFISTFLLGSSYGDDCGGQTAFNVNIENDNALQFYNQLLNHESDWGLTIDRHLRRMNGTVMFRVPQCKEASVADLIRAYNVQNYRSEPVGSHSMRRMQFDLTEADYDAFTVNLNEFDFDMVTKRYLTSHEISMYIDFVAAMIKAINPRISAQVTVEGISYEGRPIKSLTVQYGRKDNPVVFIDAGIHAREWHSRSLALYIMRQLINEAQRDTCGIIYTTTIVIVANVNPDGYEHSLSVDHMWRKTRRPVSGGCIGVDGNRNFDAHWLIGEREKLPCNEVYRGEAPFSEAESRTVRDIMRRLRGQCFLYISIHTFGNTILYPYGFTKKAHPNRDLLHLIAMAGVEAVAKKTGTKFIADQSGSNLYIAAGGSDDYAIDSMDVPFTYTFELGAEEFGFAVPKLQIAKAVDEGWTAIEAMILEAKALFDGNV